MARTNRQDVVAEGEIQVVHCINRCVRRAYLCGQDPLTGADYEHRRELIRQRMEYLAGIMGIEVLGYAVMSNHFHSVLRSRHDVVATWSDEEIAQKWWMLCPARKTKEGIPAEPTEFELNSIRNDKTGLKEKRVRLSSVSWFMRFLSERVAKEANKQDQCSGRFWEGRFKSQVLLDDAAILACLQYVDLNPVRANIATSIESSDFTSAQDRIVDAFGECSVGSFQCSENDTASDSDIGGDDVGDVASGREVVCGRQDAVSEVLPSRQDLLNTVLPGRQDVRRRASDKGCLSMGLGDYLQLLDWTGRQIRSDKRGAMPNNLEPLFERLGISVELWVDCVVNFRKWFRSSVGRPKAMEAAAETRSRNRAIGVRSARRVFT